MSLESPLDSKEIQPVNPEGNQSWIFIGRTDFDNEAPIFWPPDAKSQLTGKDCVAGEDWELKNWCFELWCWRRLLRVPWTARRSNQSILKEISPEYSLEGLMLKLKLQYFSYLIWRTDSLEKTLMLGKIEGMRRGWQRMRRLDGITDSVDEFE